MPTYCLGVSISHNGAAALLRDGEVVAAIEKERVTRVKHAGGDETPAVQYCLDTAGIRMSDIDLVVQNWFTPTVRGFRAFGGRYAGSELDMIFGADPDVLYGDARRPVVQISHHLAHAWSAFGPSGMDDAAVLVLDQCGNQRRHLTDWDPGCPEDADWLHREVASTYLGGRGDLKPLTKVLSPTATKFAFGHGLFLNTLGVGSMFAAVTRYCFDIFEDESGKVMALAPFGMDRVAGAGLSRFPDGRPLMDAGDFSWAAQFRHPYDLAGHREEYEVLCASAQLDLERVIVTQARALREQTGCEALCFAGGVALNCVANSRILEDTGFRRLYVQPAANDAGIALGCAMYGWHRVLGGSRTPELTLSWFGREYDDSAILAAIDRHPLLKRTRPADLTGEVARRIADGQIVGWFQGGSEWGPRALGHRSVLADPRSAAMHDRLTRQVKRRPDFQPYAPSVLAARVGEWFDLDHPSPFMLLAPRVRDGLGAQIPSVVHIDGTSRVQTVGPEHGLYHDVISAFDALTGVPMVLNTSMNVKGEPMVETPDQAVSWFIATEVDALAIGPWLVERIPIEALDFDSLRPRLTPGSQVQVTTQAEDGAVVRRGRISSRHYYRDAFDLSELTSDLLARCDGNTPVGDLVDEVLARRPLAGRDRAADKLRALLERLFVARLVDLDAP